MKKFLTALLPVLLFVACQPTETTAPTPTDTPSQETKTLETTLDEFGFYLGNNGAYSVSYPSNWNAEVLNLNSKQAYLLEKIGFAPEEVREDFIWGIATHQPSKINVDSNFLMNQLAMGWRDSFGGAEGSQSRENIVINGVDATKVTTLDAEGRSMIVIYISDGEYLYEITNGAVDDYDFESFYMSFDLQ